MRLVASTFYHANVFVFNGNPIGLAISNFLVVRSSSPVFGSSKTFSGIKVNTSGE